MTFCLFDDAPRTHLPDRSPERTRTEATLQADIRQLLLTAPLSLSEENVVNAGNALANTTRLTGSPSSRIADSSANA